MKTEEATCLDDHSILGGIGCKKNPEHAGTHAWWGHVGNVHTYITWGRRTKED
jgi:hypothetical protein